MTAKSYWLYFEPYTYVKVLDEELIIYNTENQKHLKYNNKTIIYNLLCNKSVKLSNSDLSNPEIASFINTIENEDYGGIIEERYYKEKPLNKLLPLNNWERWSIDIETKDLAVNDIISNFIECTIYLNSECNLSCSQCKNAYKQFTMCNKENSNIPEIEIDKIFELIEQREKKLPLRLNIVGGNILKYSKFNRLVNELNYDTNILKVFYIHYLNLLETDNHLDIINDYSCVLNIIISFPADLNKIEALEKQYKYSGIRHIFNFIIENEDDFNVIESFSLKHPDASISLQPYYNGNNIDLFKELVYLTEESILEQKINLRKIIARSVRNSNYFGKVIISSDKRIYTSFFEPSIAQLGQETLSEIINIAMHNNNSWYKLRKNVSPCNLCIYSEICPPLSNIEFAIDKNNLCFLK